MRDSHSRKIINMARTIGKKNIELIKKLTRIEKSRVIKADYLGNTDYSKIEERVFLQLPLQLWYTWEMAEQEIHMIIFDEIMK